MPLLTRLAELLTRLAELLTRLADVFSKEGGLLTRDPVLTTFTVFVRATCWDRGLPCTCLVWLVCMPAWLFSRVLCALDKFVAAAERLVAIPERLEPLRILLTAARAAWLEDPELGWRC